MNFLTFRFDDLNDELPAIQFENGDWYFSAKETCVFADVATEKNAAQWVRNNVPPKWMQEIKLSGKEGRPGLYLSKSGFYWAVCQGKSETALKFRDWVFEDLLPKIDEMKNGAIVSSPAQALQIATPNTSNIDRAIILERDNNLTNSYTLEIANKVLGYAPNFNKTHDIRSAIKGYPNIEIDDQLNYLLTTAEHETKIYKTLFQNMLKNLIYNHDYYYSDEDQRWYLTHVGLEYLAIAARSKNGLDFSFIGMNGALINFNKIAAVPCQPKSANGFSVKVKLSLSALMKAGRSDWYPVSEQGIEMLRRYEPMVGLANVAAACVALFATLDTAHYVYLPMTAAKPRFDRSADNSVHWYPYIWACMDKNVMFVHQHSKAKNLYQLRSNNDHPEIIKVKDDLQKWNILPASID